MATQDWHEGHVDPFWNDEHFDLHYHLESFNNKSDLIRWKRLGYTHPDTHYTGMMCDMRYSQPTYNDEIIRWAEEEYQLKDIGTSYYKMGTGVILPNHRDTYATYCKLFGVEVNDCERIVIFLEDWESGHYFEIEGTPIVDWNKGDYVWWQGDIEHMAANLGLTKRYTLQITGHK